MIGDIEVDELPAVVTKNDEAEEQTEGQRGDHEEVDGSDLFQVGLQEAAPRGRSWRSPAALLGDCELGHVVAEEAKLGLDAATAPRGIVAGEATDQLTEVTIDSRASGGARSLTEEALIFPIIYAPAWKQSTGRLRPSPTALRALCEDRSAVVDEWNVPVRIIGEVRRSRTGRQGHKSPKRWQGGPARVISLQRCARSWGSSCVSQFHPEEKDAKARRAAFPGTLAE